MAVNQQMFTELYRLRQRIKDEERKKNPQGRAPMVCSDEALDAIAKFCPKKLSDFEGIPGVGKTFIERHAPDFLAVVLKYQTSEAERGITMTPAAAETLRELEKKLVNINRRNRLLYMPRAASRYAFDLFDGAGTAEKILFGDGRPVTVCDTISAPAESKDAEETRFRRLVQLLREANKDLRERGQNDLYIGYPFVIGRMAGEAFDVRAPLALFPVAADRTSTGVRLSLDDSRDVVYNTTLVLAHFKFNNVAGALPDATVESQERKTFLDALLAFYAASDIRIQAADDETHTLPNVKFTEYRAAEFPKCRTGELSLEPCAVLGRFPTRSSSIQRDFDEILKTNTINTLLNDLLVSAEDLDFYADDEAARRTERLNDRQEVSEGDIFYINSINSSQEAVLSSIESVDKLVVQGPPGTGKSQVISNLIAEFVAKGRTVLMVSEKKTALDVVYSRLGPLSQYSLLIDDVGNKDAFYQQLSKMVALPRPEGEATTLEKELQELNARIDALVARLRAIADGLYSTGRLGVEPFRLYREGRREADEAGQAKLLTVAKCRDAALLDAPFDALEKAHDAFADEALAAKLERFFNIEASCPWMKDLRGDMSEFEAAALSEKLSALAAEVAAWKSKNFFARLFSKGGVRRGAADLAAKSFTSVRGGELLMENAAAVASGMGQYIPYQELKPLNDRLSPEERAYFRSLLRVKDACGGEAANDSLWNGLLCEHISRFEAEHRALLQDISEFEGIVRALGEGISKKQELVRERLSHTLAQGMSAVSDSKRRGEILRVLESRRRWSVGKFVKKFEFELFKGVKVWLMTPEVVSEILPLTPGLFDLVVFDEASQMYVEKGLPSILRGRKVIIAGDHKQLRPCSLGAGRIETDAEDAPEDAETGAALEEESLLDLARFKYPDVLLNFHYRSKYEELIAFSNYAVYQGRLCVSPNAEPPELPPIEFHKLNGALWEGRTNRAEAEYIVEMLKRFLNERRRQETMGIITFNISQRDLIEDLLDEACAKDPEFAAMVRAETMRSKDGEDVGLFVKNIESVQGDERDVIIFSIGYARNEAGKLIRNFGWLNQRGGENRLNVAVSRAKRKIHVVASFEPSELSVEDTKNEGPRILKKYLEYARAVSDGNSVRAKQVLLSFGAAETPAAGAAPAVEGALERALTDALTARGWEVDRQVGIGGYNIDLALKRDGKYVLGLECDGRLYRSPRTTRDRDFHRQDYLESRGWRLYRVWSSNWWRDPQGEIERICARAEQS